MEDLMCNSKLNRVEVGKCEEESDKVVAVPKSELELAEVTHHFEKEQPVHGHCHVEADAEEDIVGLKMVPLLLCGVTSVLCKYLIEEW